MNDTFQLVLSTDGEVSFAALIFKAPQVLTSFARSTNFVRIGFDGSRFSTLSANVGEFLIRNDLEMAPVSIYRIDGNEIPLIIIP